MKRLLQLISLTVASALFAVQVVAHDASPSFRWFEGSHKVPGTVLESYPVYEGGSTKTSRVCEDVKVPIYAQNDQANRTGDMLAGAVIGGIIGKAVTGKDAGAFAGAVIGGAAAANANQNKVVGYRWERQCHDVEVVNDKLLYYESRIRLDGKIYRVRTRNGFDVGQTVYMYVH